MCLDAAAKHLVAELASVWAAVNLINLNYSVYTNKQAAALDAAGASDGLALGEKKGAKATAHKSFASGQLSPSLRDTNNTRNVSQLAR